jgi:hypothetical protein
MKAAEPHSQVVLHEFPEEHPARSEHVITETSVRHPSASLQSLVPLAGWLAGEDSAGAVRVHITGADGRCVASAVVTPADESRLVRRLKLPSQPLSKCAVVSDVALEKDAPRPLAAALLYLCARRGRIWDRAVLAAPLAADRSPDHLATLVGLDPLKRVPHFEVHGQPWSLAAQTLDISIHRAWSAATPTLQAALQEQFVAELVETLERWIQRFFANSWFQAVRDGTLTKEQYVHTLANLHQFVRWTTRHIGRAVACSHDRAIRDKWLEHLQGEVNHEVIIEKDLAALGADVDYVVHSMQPSLPNLQFIVTQEAMVAFHADPVLIMASPFVAEGFAAHLDQKFVDDLRRTAKSWGIDNPKQVTAFLASHIDFDGGQDGHWEQSRRMLHRYLRTEGELARFLGVVRLCQDAFNRSYAGYFDDLAVFGVTPSAGAT